MTPTVRSLFIIYMAFNILIFIFLTFCVIPDCDKFDEYFFMPNHLYNLTKMNIVGCYISSIILFFIIPIYYIFYILFWSFHVGRKKLIKNKNMY